MKSQHLIQALLAALSLTLLLMLIELLGNGTVTAAFIYWNLLSNFLICSVLGMYVLQSTYSSRKLWFSTFAIFYVIGFFNVLIEAIIFNVMDRAIMLRPLLVGIPYTLIGSLVIVFLFGRFKAESPHASPAYQPRKKVGWIGKILLANFLYIFFYLAAGITIEKLTPGFSEFYEGKLPSPATFFATNVFFRGFVFVGIAILIDRSLYGDKIGKGLLIGLIFSIIGGIAPLIPPSEFMPDYIRVAHGLEVGVSNFLYGVCVYLIVKSKVVQPIPQTA